MLDAWTKAKGNRRMSENYYPTSGGMLNWCKYALVNVSNFFYQSLVGPNEHESSAEQIALLEWLGLAINLKSPNLLNATTADDLKEGVQGG
eukprot:18608-Pelagomonas_calceolata.AAC.1